MRWNFIRPGCCCARVAAAIVVFGAVFDSAVAGGPANDECSAAINVFNGNTAFTNVGAVTDGPAEPGLCNFFGNTQVGADVWFRYQASCSGTATVSLCNSTFDTKVAVYGAACPVSSAAIACNDDACGGGGGTRSRVSFAVVSGQFYLIRVGGFNSAQGSGTMNITCVAVGPLNDDCADASAIGNGSHAFSTVGATTDGPAESICLQFGSDQVTNDVWFRYTAACSGTATAATCGSAFDTRVAVYEANCPVTAAAVECNDDACGEQSSATFDVLIGNEYLIRVGGYIGATGSGTLTLSCTPNPPGNDDCVNASTVFNGTFTFSTLSASTDGPAEPLCASGGDNQVGNDIWFVYEAPCTSEVIVSLCDSDYDTRLAVYNENCPSAAAALACNNDACGTPANRSELRFAALLGQRFLIRVGGHLGATGNGTMTIACAAGACSVARGDANCDGTVDFFDIDPFLLALFDLPAYEAVYCEADWCPVDVDCSAIVDFFDIDPFLACLFGTCPPCP